MSERSQPNGETYQNRIINHAVLVGRLEEYALDATTTLRRRLLPAPNKLSDPIAYAEVEQADVELDIYSPYGWPPAPESRITYGYNDHHPMLQHFTWVDSAAGRKISYQPPYHIPGDSSQEGVVIIDGIRTRMRRALHNQAIYAWSRHTNQLQIVINDPGVETGSDVAVMLFENNKNAPPALAATYFLSYPRATKLLEASHIGHIITPAHEATLKMSMFALNCIRATSPESSQFDGGRFWKP